MAEINNTPKIRFIGIGAPKCGTTWVYECLEEHPGICMGKPKEIHFFNRYHGFDSEDKGEQYTQGLEKYYEHFESCPADAIIGEFSPKYLYDSAVPERIKRNIGPDTKLLIILRHPVDRAFSHYKHFKSKFPEKYASFEDAIRLNPDILEWSRYEKYIPAFLHAFPREQVLVKIFDDLERDPKSFMQDIYRFVGADDSFVPPSVNRKINASEQRFSEKRKRRMSRLFKIRKTLKGIPLTRSLLTLIKKTELPALLRKQVDREIDKKAITEVNAELTNEIRDRIAAQFKNDVEAVEALIGHRIPEWHE